MKKLVTLTVSALSLACGSAFAGPGNDGQARMAATSNLAPIGEWSAESHPIKGSRTTVAVYKSGEKSTCKQNSRTHSGGCCR